MCGTGEALTNQTTGFTTTFPSPALNAKANTALLSIEKLADLNCAGDIGDGLVAMCAQTSIPNSSTIDAAQNPTTPRYTIYFENVIWNGDLENSAKNWREAFVFSNGIGSMTICVVVGVSYGVFQKIVQWKELPRRVLSTMLILFHLRWPLRKS
eukprot:SAG31_NODE_635_length_13360_cov_4.229847_1_plen_154_part_00